ncbi:MAG: CRTAC1 family protein [Acidimicrobiia bacterium]|nr:CRTAC1 family protein [Acidimicrobiia bacterium]
MDWKGLRAPGFSPARTPTSRSARLWLLLGAVIGVAVMSALVLALASRFGPPPDPAALAPPRFVDESTTAGIGHVYRGGFEYFVGGGVATFDCDDDLLPELFLAGGTEPAAVYRNRSTVGGALSFDPIPDTATDLKGVTGAYPLDVDGDGLTDLAVLRIGENVLLRGLGDCRFERANERWGFDGGDGWTVGFSAQWPMQDDRLPTMVFGNYLRSADDRVCDEHALLVPVEAGAAYEAPIPVSPGWCALSMLFSDWSGTGVMDLRVANDRHYYQGGQEQLLRLEAGRLIPFTSDEGWRPLQIWGMGIASTDLTGDGRPEIYITSQGDNKLQTLVDGADGPAYTDIALERGVTAHRPHTGGDALPSTAWHPQFADVNNDGLVDLFVSKGNVDAMPEFARRDPSNLLIARADGTFAEAAEVSGVVSFDRARGAAVVDLNGDGLLDLIQVNREVEVGVWRNVGFGRGAEVVGAGAGDEADADGEGRVPAATPMGHWLAVRARQAGPNPDAVGGRVQVRDGEGRIQDRELTVGGGHASGSVGPVHVGLGPAVEAEVRVVWPDGERTDWWAVQVDQFVLIERGGDVPVTLSPLGDGGR